MCLLINNWDNFIINIKYFYDFIKRKYNLKWFKKCNVIIINFCNQNDEIILNVLKCYEEGDVVFIC